MQWRFLTDALGTTYPRVSTPCVDNAGNIYFASSTILYSLTPAGTLRWHATQLNISGVSNGPVIGWDGSIYVSGSYLLYAYDNAGTARWTRPLPPSESTPAIDLGGIVYVGSSRAGSDTSNFYAYKSDGSLKFKLALTNATGGRVDITSSPALSSDGSLYVGSDRVQANRLFKIK
jgi:outer membrane protein assembly factor BamB